MGEAAKRWSKAAASRRSSSSSFGLVTSAAGESNSGEPPPFYANLFHGHTYDCPFFVLKSHSSIVYQRRLSRSAQAHYTYAEFSWKNS